MNWLLASVDEETTDNAGFVLVCFCGELCETNKAGIEDY
jgi:hypothetical protein